MRNEELSAWVKEAIAHSGMTQTGLAAELTAALSRSIDKFAVSKMTLGKRAVAADEMLQIARITGFAPPEDEGTTTEEMTPIVGYVGAGAVYVPFETSAIGEIARPPWANERTVCAEIRGDSLGSMFDQWLVYYDDVLQAPTPSMLGKLCIIGLADRRVVVKKLMRGKEPGLYTLLSNFETPIYDVAVDWCALVKNMAPR